MDLEVVGRHALLFDDDAMAAFVNSGDALVEWYSLQIDRYDVRHLLSGPPPSRRRSRSSEHILLDDLSLESQLDHERYLDLPTHSGEQDVEEDEHQLDASGYRAVPFSYGNTDDSADQKNADAGMESSGFLPHFPIPEILRHCLVAISGTLYPFDVMARTLQPPTEKVHQIIARTGMFVSKHGGQSEIILRVKQGDNPTFGFLMPDHHLHAYFRFLVEHPELLYSESDGNSQNEHKKAGGEQNSLNGVGGALSLLGSVYGSGEEEEGDDTAKTEKDISQDSTYSVDRNVSQGSKNIDSQADPAKGESVSKNPVLSSKEKVMVVKKNSLISGSKSGAVKSMGEKSRLSSAAADKAKSSSGMTSKIEPLILEPPLELKGLIDKIVEFIMRHGKQFEATLIEQDSKHGRFPFLLPSNQYHSYYLKVLKTVQESKMNGTSFYSGKDDLVGHGMARKASVLKEKDFPSLASALCDMPLEYDRKEKFKMVIGKSKKETQETEPRETQQECGITVDAAAAAAILQAATRGIKRTSQSAYVNMNSSEDGHPGDLGSVPPSQPDNAVEKSSQSGSHNVTAVGPRTIARVVAVEATSEADSSEAHLTKEQKLKAERLKRAKMFVAMLKSGGVPFKTGTSSGTSLEPLESGISKSAGGINLVGKEKEGSLAPADVGSPATGEKPPTNYFGEEHSDRLSKRKYRSRPGGCQDDDDDDDGDMKEHNEHHPRKKFRSRSRRHNEDDEDENAVETEEKYHRRRNRIHSSSEENEDENGSTEEKRDHKNYKFKHRSHHSQQEDDCEAKYKEDKNHRRSRKKHHSHRSSREHSRKRHSSKRYLQDEDEYDDHGRDKKQSRKKLHSSHHRRNKHRHKSGHSSRDRESHHNVKHGTSSTDERQGHSINKHKRELYDERDELEEGEISSRVSEGSRRTVSGHISRETSVDVASFHQRAPSQLSDTTSEVPDDLRAKIRAMLIETL